MTVIDNKFDFGDLVYLKTDEDQKVRLVTGFRVYPGGGLIYYLSCGNCISDHYEFEISSEKNVLV